VSDVACHRVAWHIAGAGSLDRLRLVEEPLPSPAPDEARVRVEAIGLNFADAVAAQGLYSATPRGAFVPGLECAGIVESLGSAVPEHSGIAIGDRVMVLTRFGAYATALNARVALLRRAPPGWTAAECAAWPVQGLTAWYGLVTLGDVHCGDIVLVQSAAGGVGLMALDVLAALGARPLAVVGGESKRQFLIEQRGLPLEAVILRDARGFGARLDASLAALGGTGFDCVLDAVLGPTFRPAFERLRPEGRYVLYGAAQFMSPSSRPAYARLAFEYLRRPRLDPLAMIAANRSLMAFNLIWLWDRTERLPEAYAALERLVPGAPFVSEEFPFERAPQALRRLQSGETIGKVVLVVG
jgi:alcohol dehydrogenase